MAKMGQLDVEYEPYPHPGELAAIRQEVAYDSLFPSDDVVMTLYKERFGVQAVVDLQTVKAMSRFSFEEDRQMAAMVYSMWMDVFGRRLLSIKAPDTWWDAFKERWFPRWALRQSPVVYRRWDLVALQPFFRAPDEQSVLRLIES